MRTFRKLLQEYCTNNQEVILNFDQAVYRATILSVEMDYFTWEWLNIETKNTYQMASLISDVKQLFLAYDEWEDNPPLIGAISGNLKLQGLSESLLETVLDTIVETLSPELLTNSSTELELPAEQLSFENYWEHNDKPNDEDQEDDTTQVS